ncbi:MAG: fumarylacetoacetate hydrolase family protein [Thermoleophilia bacterium]|nr:fumarylacetoacetate hydrolase family protein [Thermoleophilia bacterium]
MKIARIYHQGQICQAVVEGDTYVVESPSDLAGEVVKASESTLLPPVSPGKIIGVGWNFRPHIKEMAKRAAQAPGTVVSHQPTGEEELPPPLFFLKPPSSLVGSGQAIVYPRDAVRVEYEGELAVVIGRPARRVTPEEAREVVWGWTCANDVTERQFQAADNQWWRAKGYDTFAVAGPFLETEAPSSEAWIRTKVNGELRQEAQLKEMIRDPFTVISLVSQAMTLWPGDLIMLGTPEGVGELRPGDQVEVIIDGVGRLWNPVVPEEEAARLTS